MSSHEIKKPHELTSVKFLLDFFYLSDNLGSGVGAQLKEVGV